MSVVSFLRTRECGGKVSSPLRIDRDGAGEVRVRWWAGAHWERVWAHQRYRCDVGYPGCGFLRHPCSSPVPMGVVHCRRPPRRTCQASSACGHETALHYLVGCGDVEAVKRAVRRGWVLGATVDENADFLELKEQDIVSNVAACIIDVNATTEPCSAWSRYEGGGEGGGEGGERTAMDMLIADDINWPEGDRSAEMVGALLDDRPPTADLLWRARGNAEVARELLRHGAPHADAVVDEPPNMWSTIMADAPSPCSRTPFTRLCGTTIAPTPTNDETPRTSADSSTRCSTPEIEEIAGKRTGRTVGRRSFRTCATTRALRRGFVVRCSQDDRAQVHHAMSKITVASPSPKRSSTSIEIST